jgi:hypothetical protein
MHFFALLATSRLMSAFDSRPEVVRVDASPAPCPMPPFKKRLPGTQCIGKSTTKRPRREKQPMTYKSGTIAESENHPTSRLQSRIHAAESSRTGTDYTITEKEQLRHDAINAAKKAFERKRDRVLLLVPQSIRDKYGEIGFATWLGSMRPVLVLNPYHVPPAPVREYFFVCIQTLVLVAFWALIYLATHSLHPQYLCG